DSVRDFGSPVVIGFGHEMNAYWYSWGYRHTPAATFVAAWRHIVTLFRARHRPGRLLVAGAAVRHLGRHRRLLLPSVRDVLQHFRPDHRPGPDADRPPRAALRDRSGPAGRAGRQDSRAVRRDAPVRHARPGLVRHRPARRALSPGLA